MITKRNFIRTVAAGCIVAAMGAGSASAGGPSIFRVLETNAQFSTLTAAVKAAGLEKTLKGDGPLTLFAPSDYAFSKLPAGTVETLLKPENKDKLIAILTYHVVPGAVTADKLVGTQQDVATVEGQTVSVDGRHGVRVNGVTVSQADIIAGNGVIHRIDAVLLPK